MIITPTSEQDLENMRMVCRLKLEQHPELKELLKSTGDQLIVEDVTSRAKSGRNSFWGAYLHENQWVGNNSLGKIWMDLRKEL